MDAFSFGVGMIVGAVLTGATVVVLALCVAAKDDES